MIHHENTIVCSVSLHHLSLLYAGLAHQSVMNLNGTYVYNSSSSDEVKMELAKMCILPLLINWVTLPNKNDKVAVFAAKTLVMLHLIGMGKFVTFFTITRVVKY